MLAVRPIWRSEDNVWLSFLAYDRISFVFCYGVILPSLTPILQQGIADLCHCWISEKELRWVLYSEHFYLWSHLFDAKALILIFLVPVFFLIPIQETLKTLLHTPSTD